MFGAFWQVKKQYLQNLNLFQTFLTKLKKINKDELVWVDTAIHVLGRYSFYLVP